MYMNQGKTKDTTPVFVSILYLNWTFAGILGLTISKLQQKNIAINFFLNIKFLQSKIKPLFSQQEVNFPEEMFKVCAIKRRHFVARKFNLR